MAIHCPDCGQPMLDTSLRCASCGRPAVRSLRRTSGNPGNGAFGSVVGISAVVAIVLLGSVALLQRQAAVAAYDATTAAERAVDGAHEPASGAAPGRDAPGTYTVQPGDQLFDIAARHGRT